MSVEIPQIAEDAPVREIATIIGQFSENVEVIGVNEELSFIEFEGIFSVPEFRMVTNETSCMPINVVPVSEDRFRIVFAHIDNITSDLYKLNKEIEQECGIEMFD